MAPLKSIEKIEARLDAVSDLIEHDADTNIIRCRLKKYPDIEKLLAKIFTYSIKKSIKAIYFEDVSLTKMREFRNLLNAFRQVEDDIGSLRSLHRRGKLRSERLIALVTNSKETKNGLLPENILEAIHEFDRLIKWTRERGAPICQEKPEP